MAQKFYAVKTGITPGIYTDWDLCKAQVDGYPNAAYKSFKTLKEAESWLGVQTSIEPDSSGDKPQPKPGCAIAYVDGSYNEGVGKFSYGVVFFIDNEEIHFSKAFSNPELLLMRNVAGEIMGAGQAMKTARERGCKQLTIFHDYQGIAKWCTGEWKAKQSWTQAYKRFYDEITQTVSVDFQKVKAHSKDKYNDLADELAKAALEQ